MGETTWPPPGGSRPGPASPSPGRSWRSTCSATGCATCSTRPAAAAVAEGDRPVLTLLTNAFVYVGDAEETAFPSGAILIDGARIAQVGPAEQLAERRADRVIDARGRVALPGFINCHTHAALTANRADSDDLELFPWLADGARRRTPNRDDLVYSCYLGAFEMLKGGITYAVDCGRREPLMYARVAREVGQRCLSGSMANSEELRPGAGNWPDIVRETRLALDELPQDADGMTRYFLGAHSPYSCTPDLLREAKRSAEQ